MTNEWREFLSSHSAPSDRLTFPNPDDPRDCRLIDLSHLGLIGAQGADADAFLQGQLTSDIRELSERRSQLGGYCSPKGRMLASFRLIRTADRILLQAPAERIPDMLKRLGMFILRSQVKLADLSEEIARVGLSGDCAPGLLQRQGLEPPAADGQQLIAGDLILIRIPGPIPRFELLAPPAELVRLCASLAEEAAPGNRLDWTLLDIQAGIPSVYDRTAEAFVPQMTNLHLVDGVSFNKGCYMGQEVVARMQFLGKLKRRMYLAEVQASPPPQPGDELFSASSRSQQGSGRVVDVCPLSGDGRHALLVVAEIGSAEADDLRLGEQGPPLRLREPPYGLPAPG